MKFYDKQQTKSALPELALIEQIEQTFVQGCQVPLRHNHPICDQGEQVGTVLLMPAWQEGGLLGVKTVAIYPNNAKQSLPGLHSVYTLFDATTGVPMAIFDGDVITSRRTAAASALAGKYLSRADSRHLLVVGAGRVGELMASMYKAVRPIETVTVYNPTVSRAEKLVETLKSQGFDAHVATDLQQAAGQADIISCATLSTAPLIYKSWLKAGTHLDLIGSFTPIMQEADVSCFEGTSIFVDTSEALMKAGDLLKAIDAGVMTADSVQADLTALCHHRHVGRQSDDEITVFKSVGTGLEDLAAATLAYRTLNV